MNIDQMIIDGNRRLLKGDGELLVKACEYVRAKRMVEIGSFDGGSTNILGTMAKKYDGFLYCIEPYPTGKWRDNIKKYDIEDYVMLIQDISPKAAYDQRIPDCIDLLFIDGDHRVSHTIADFIAFAPKLSVGGIYVQHDWCGGMSRQYGCRRVKDMIRQAISIILEDYPCFEEFDRSEGSDRGAVALIKTKEMKMNIR